MFSINKFDRSNKVIRHRLTADLGMQRSFISYFGQYERALNILMNHILETGCRIDVISHPVLYLMRHALELAYKGNLEYFAMYTELPVEEPRSGGHSLQDLHEQLGKHIIYLIEKLHIDADTKQTFDAYYIPTADLLDKLRGTEASIFRYPMTIKKEKFFNRDDQLDIGELVEQFQKASILLTHSADNFSRYTDYVDLMKLKPDFKRGKGEVMYTFADFEKEYVFEKMDTMFKRIDDDLWVDEPNNQKILALVVQKKLYFLPVD